MKSLNKVQLIGNVTKDPELKYTNGNTAVASFTVATNRQWTTEAGEKKDEADFHRCIAWSKLGEICSQLLKKGRKVFIEGRLQNRSWVGTDGVTKYATEIIVSDMILLDKSDDEKETDKFVDEADKAITAREAEESNIKDEDKIPF